MHQGGVERTDGDGVDADDLVLRVEEQDNEVLAISAVEVLLKDARGGGAVDLLPLGGLASIADELHLVDRDAVHGCLRRRVAVVAGSFLHPAFSPVLRRGHPPVRERRIRVGRARPWMATASRSSPRIARLQAQGSRRASARLRSAR